MRVWLVLLALLAGCGGGSAAGAGPTGPGGSGGGGAGGGGSCSTGPVQELGATDDKGQIGVTPVDGGVLVTLRPDRETIHLFHLKQDGVMSKRIWLTGDVRPSVERPPRAAWNGQQYLVSWIEQPPDGMASLRARVVDADGNAQGPIIGIANFEITGGVDLLVVDGNFVGIWVAGIQLSGIRVASVNTELPAVDRRTIDLGFIGLEDLRAESIPGGIQVAWKNGRVQLSAGGEPVEQATEGNGIPRGDPRPASYAGSAPRLPGEPIDASMGVALGDRLAVAWAETQATSYRIRLGIFDGSGAMVGGPYDVGESSGGTTDVPMGIAPYGDGIAVFWVDKPNSKAFWSHVSGCR